MKIYYCDETKENVVTLDEMDGDLIKNKSISKLIRDFTNMGFRKINIVKLTPDQFKRTKECFRIYD